MDSKLKDKHVLITGASGGIGSVTTECFLREHAKVTCQYFSQQKLLERLQNNYRSTFTSYKADLRNESDVIELFKHANQKFGRVDVLIANAGIWPTENTPIYEMTLERWTNTLNTNLTSIFLSIKHFILNLGKYPSPNASIVLTGSTAGIFGEADHSDYASSKAALKAIMLSVKNEIVTISSKARVNMVNPGWTRTPMAKEALTDASRVKKVLQTISLQKLATSEDIANTILFLSSDALAGHISGQTITVAGGMEGRVLFEKDEINF